MIVCDGFIGNVALKVSEGLVEMIKSMLQESLEATITRKIGYVLSKAAFTDFKRRVDYSEYGGAPLLGVQASASSATDVRTPTPSRTESASLRSLQAGKSTIASKVNSSVGHPEKPVTNRQIRNLMPQMRVARFSVLVLLAASSVFAQKYNPVAWSLRLDPQHGPAQKSLPTWTGKSRPDGTSIR